MPTYLVWQSCWSECATTRPTRVTRGGVLYKRERPPCPIASPAVLDPDWIPEVTSQDWLIVTRDANIAVNRAEIAAVRDNNARMVTLASRKAKGTWEQPESIRPSWPISATADIEAGFNSP